MTDAAPDSAQHPIRLRNTLTRRVEPFIPADPKNVRMYVCGPTVYDRAHLGNARSAVVFDVLFRLLRHVYGAEHVTYVRNITDIDDKIIARARETGRSVESITEETTRWYHEDMDALGCLRPTHEPRATQYLPQMIAMIRALIKRGHAYEASGHVLFAVESYPDYGRLSGRSTEDMIAGARVEVAPYKRHPMDFVLWKPSPEGTPGWDSPWGLGRPGWHIECSAMARDLLGGAFDIHGGGLDLQFPHHENEIAQSRCAHPDEGFAKVWVHNEMLRVEGEKMSKSLGNFLTVRDLLDRDVPGEVIRLVLLGTHYGKPMDWTERKVKETEDTIGWWDMGMLSEFEQLQDSSGDCQEVIDRIVNELANDLNSPQALATLHELRALSNERQLVAGLATLGAVPYLGIAAIRQSTTIISQGLANAERRWKDLKDDFPQEATLLSGETPITFLKRETFENVRRYGLIEKLEARADARSKKDFLKADQIRDTLRELGIDVIDTSKGQRWRPTKAGSIQ